MLLSIFGGKNLLSGTAVLCGFRGIDLNSRCGGIGFTKDGSTGYFAVPSFNGKTGFKSAYCYSVFGVNVEFVK